MLELFDPNGPVSRRALLRAGALSLGGLALPDLLRAAGAGNVNPQTGKSVIFLFQQGGPSQLETFDPKTDVPESTRTVGGSVPTSIPGIHFGSSLPQLAKLAHKLNVVRSFSTNNAGHNIRPIVGPESLETNIGVHYARVVGTTRSSSGVPTNAVLFPEMVNPDFVKGKARGDLSSTGEYAKSLGPFVPGGGGQLQADLKVGLSPERLFGDRRALLKKLDALNRNADATGQINAVDEMQRQAFEVLLGGKISRALDLANEDPKTLARYNTGKFGVPGKWDKVNRGKKGFYASNARSIGHLLLMARRLCEAGAGFVTIHAGYDGVWDMHADGNNLNMADGMEAVGGAFDHAVAAFIEDLESSGLREKILLVATGEMGRTPKINKNGGRDHWSKLAPLLLYGGGYEGGQIIGESTRDGGEPNSAGYDPKNLISTILNTLLDAGKLRLMPEVPTTVQSLIGEKPIPVA